MISRIVTSIISSFLIFSGCAKQENPIPGDIVLTEKSQQLVRSDNTFGFKLFSAIPQNHDHNVMISPLSVSMALSMALNGADGETKTAIRNALSFEGLTPDEINSIYLNLVSALKKADDKVIMKIANSIWIKKGFPVLESFTKINHDFYDASVMNLEFNQAAINTINNWVSSNTNGKIPSIHDSISPEEIMFLINAIYFNGKWQIQFDPSKTTNSEFKLANGQGISVPMMKLKEKFAWSQQNGYKVLKMPYGRGKFNMIILLPDEGSSLESIVPQFDRTKWEALLSSLDNSSEIDVWLPKFEYSWEIELNQALSSLGMGIAFTDKADFSKINSGYQLLITKVRHKTYIKVNEEGTEAAAATSVGIGVTSMPANPAEFHVTRPFLYVITEEDTGAMLFLGKVENPLFKE
jgi:serine protease inhibitor